ncbi:MAG: GGDEF domain-containing protein [Roseovarius sp.]|nr:GGDEF domain-containing protein [Roseovarius sp.]
MTIYLFLARIFPRSFTAKVFCIAFVGTHVPLISLLAFMLVAGSGFAGYRDALLLILGATLLGTAATLFALRALLAPLYRIEEGMRVFEEDETIPTMPDAGDDELGRLMQRANRLMTRVKSRMADVRKSADTDPLTGLLNRRGFDRVVAADAPGAVMLLDLDHFKAVNDRFGHDAGDAVLRDLAGVLRTTLRKTDVVARFGGEEFIAFLPHTDEPAAVEIAERLCRAVEDGLSVAGRPVTASIGVSAGHDDIAARIKRADVAVYASKNEGRNRVRRAA